jgi:hypothetical protein
VPRALRQAKNRELFRAVNEQIANLAVQFSADSQGFVCECSQIGCAEQIEVPLAVYGQVRETPSAYLVRAGHEDPTAEETIVGHRTYLIVVVRSHGGTPHIGLDREE